MDPAEGTKEAKNLTLHHVGIVARNIEETAALYVRSFGYEPRTGIIHDPVQIAIGLAEVTRIGA